MTARKLACAVLVLFGCAHGPGSGPAGDNGKADGDGTDSGVVKATCQPVTYKWHNTPFSPVAAAAFAAAQSHSLDQLDALLASGADPNETDAVGRTPLHAVAQAMFQSSTATSAPVIAALVHAGADPNRGDVDGVTPLMLAAQWDDVAGAGALLDAGADPARKAASGWTALLATASEVSIGKVQDRTALATRLLDAGAPLDDAPLTDGKTALMLAAQRAWPGSDAEALAELLVARGASTRRADCAGDTPLIDAAAEASGPLIAALLASGGGAINHRDDAGKTALSIAASGAVPGGVVALAHDRELAVEPSSVVTGNALSLLARYYEVDELTTLLDKGADPNALGAGGSTAIAAWALGPDATLNVPVDPAKAMPTLSALLARGADPNLPDGAALLHTVLVLDLPSTDALLSNGANVNVRDASGRTPLIYALRADPRNDLALQDQVIARLLQAGADVNARTDDGLTVLMYTFASPFAGAGEPPLQTANGFNSVLAAVSNDTLWARDAEHHNAVEYALAASGTNPNPLNLPTTPAELIAAEMNRRLGNTAPTCACAAYTDGEPLREASASTCDAADVSVRAQVPSAEVSFTDFLCWLEPT